MTAIYAKNGWIGQWLDPLGIQVAYTPLGIWIALTFIGLPFVVRTVQPVIQVLDRGLEEAAATLGAGRIRTFLGVIFPTLLPSLLTGFALAFARCLGEFGSIQFMSSNLPYQTQIAPQLIVERLDAYELEAALSIAVFLLGVSFFILGAINLLEARARRFQIR